MELVKALLKQPYWLITLAMGAALVVLPCVTVDSDHSWRTHPPTTYVPVWVGGVLLLLSASGFLVRLQTERSTKAAGIDAGLDLRRVKEDKGVPWTITSGCQVRVITGRIEDQRASSGVVVVLPCNEYFDDRCAGDTGSALGAYVNRLFEGQVPAFVSLMKAECRKKLGQGAEQQKTDEERAESYGPGRCILLTRPLGRSATIALVSTTTQRAAEGLSARISYLFDGMREMVARLADARLSEAMMPVLGAGHGGIDPPLAFVGLLLAVAEAARYGQGGRHLRKVTIVVFKADAASAPEVDPLVVRRALALIGSRG